MASNLESMNKSETTIHICESLQESRVEKIKLANGALHKFEVLFISGCRKPSQTFVYLDTHLTAELLGNIMMMYHRIDLRHQMKLA